MQREEYSFDCKDPTCNAKNPCPSRLKLIDANKCFVCHKTPEEVDIDVYYFKNAAGQNMYYAYCKQCIKNMPLIDFYCDICSARIVNVHKAGIQFQHLKLMVTYIVCSVNCNSEANNRIQNSLSNHLVWKQCANCEQRMNDMQRCSRCKLTYYCSKACQKANWQIHKKVCKPN